MCRVFNLYFVNFTRSVLQILAAGPAQVIHTISTCYRIILRCFLNEHIVNRGPYFDVEMPDRVGQVLICLFKYGRSFINY